MSPISTATAVSIFLAASAASAYFSRRGALTEHFLSPHDNHVGGLITHANREIGKRRTGAFISRINSRSGGTTSSGYKSSI